MSAVSASRRVSKIKPLGRARSARSGCAANQPRAKWCTQVLPDRRSEVTGQVECANASTSEESRTRGAWRTSTSSDSSRPARAIFLTAQARCKPSASVSRAISARAAASSARTSRSPSSRAVNITLPKLLPARAGPTLSIFAVHKGGRDFCDRHRSTAGPSHVFATRSAARWTQDSLAAFEQCHASLELRHKRRSNDRLHLNPRESVGGSSGDRASGVFSRDVGRTSGPLRLTMGTARRPCSHGQRPRRLNRIGRRSHGARSPRLASA